MNTKRTFRVKLAGDHPRLGIVTSRLWLATLDVMLPAGGPGRDMIPASYRIARRLVVRV